MGRIGWSDAHAHVLAGQVSVALHELCSLPMTHALLCCSCCHQLDVFENIILEPLIKDMFKYTWFTERYDCKGNRMR
jgi:hypothetical protein